MKRDHWRGAALLFGGGAIVGILAHRFDPDFALLLGWFLLLVLGVACISIGGTLLLEPRE